MADSAAALAAALQDRYRLERQLGQGGMATVFLAEDLRNRRKVALKVLRPEIAAILGERFLQEIETTANLHHPHILPLFDNGQAGGFLYYAMPFVSGETLRDRLTREKQLPLADALRITTDVADALDYAHRSGILHRDIKPENILLHDGRALVADFGVALAMKNAGGTRLTETGLALGTPQYMSPEQATAERDLDARTDVYALGAVAYEMLTGEAPFTGSTTQAIIAKRMIEAPRPISVLRQAVPRAVEAAILAALERLPADRPASAAAFAAALSGPAAPAHAFTSGTRAPASPARPWLVAAMLVLVLAASALAFRAWRGGAGHRLATLTTRATIPLGQGLLLSQDGLPFDISPDGARIVYAAQSDGEPQLYLRPVGSFEGKPLPGTEGASQPFFSPDGRWVGFFMGGKLQKVPAEGGSVTVLAELSTNATGGVWGGNGTIWFAQGDTSLYKVPDKGGRPVAVTLRAPPPAPEDSGLSLPPLRVLRWPSLLPDGKHALVGSNLGPVVFALESGEVRPLFRGSVSNRGSWASRARYLPTGHLIYDQDDGRLRVVPFDLGRLEVTGEPIGAFETFRGPGGGAAQFAVSETGTLVYVAGGYNRTLVMVNHDGRVTPLPFPPRGYRFPAVSPDGKRVAVTIDPRPSSIWLADLERGQLQRLTTEGHNIAPVWSPDGERLAFSSSNGLSWLRWRSEEGPKVILNREGMSGVYPTAWARDGRIVLQHYDRLDRDILTMTLEDTTPRPLLATRSVEGQGAVSPDGRWLAFLSNMTGADEVYLRPYPGGGPNTLVSSRGGVEPRWSRHGRELYYRQGSRIMAVTLTVRADGVSPGPPRELFSGDYDFSQDRNWDVGPDGRFVMVRADPASRGQFLAVLNWFAELEQAAVAR